MCLKVNSHHYQFNPANTSYESRPLYFKQQSTTV